VKEGFFKVPFDGFGTWIFLHTLIANATVREEYCDFAALVSLLFGGCVATRGHGGGVFVVRGRSGHFGLFEVWFLLWWR
jgi:hypothetical protein